MKKILLFVLLNILFIVPHQAQSVFLLGDGSPENPWIITTPDQLASINNSSACYQLGKSIIHIGPSINQFYGTLDGKGYTIITNNQLPLFNQLSMATISELRVWALESVNQGGDGVAVIASHIDNSNLEQVGAYGKLVYSGNCAGGFAGNIQNSSLKHCWSDVEITENSNHGTIGGFIGVANNSTIDQCFAKGKITSPGSNIGGLVGVQQSGTIQNSFTEVTINHTGMVQYTPGFYNPYSLNRPVYYPLYPYNPFPAPQPYFNHIYSPFNGILPPNGIVSEQQSITASNLGGIVGNNYGQIKYSYASGNILYRNEAPKPTSYNSFYQYSHYQYIYGNYCYWDIQWNYQRCISVIQRIDCYYNLILNPENYKSFTPKNIGGIAGSSQGDIELCGSFSSVIGPFQYPSNMIVNQSYDVSNSIYGSGGNYVMGRMINGVHNGQPNDAYYKQMDHFAWDQSIWSIKNPGETFPQLTALATIKITPYQSMNLRNMTENEIPTSTELIDGAASLICYPNPVVDHLIITSPVQIKKIKVINMNGAIVYMSSNEYFDGNQMTISVRNWRKGTYIIHITTDDFTTTRKIVKK